MGGLPSIIGVSVITQLFARGTGLLSSGEIDVLRSSRTSIVLRRLAVVLVVLLIVVALIAVRLFVHHDLKNTDWAALCNSTAINTTHPPTVDYSLYDNVTLAPCNDTADLSAVRLPPTIALTYLM